MTVGFIGLGHMGLPMARNLVRAGLAVRVWNRTPERCNELVALGAQAAATVDELCGQVDVVALMLLDEAAVDAVLGRHTPDFRRRICGRTWVQLGTTSPDYSLALARDIAAAGGRYLEAPVSGSTAPATEGRLVGMVAGDADTINDVAPLLRPLCRAVFACGPVPHALRMKLAVNHYLIATVAALAETVHAARAAGLDVEVLRQILDAGPMASDVSRRKLDKLIARDHQPHAAIRDVYTIVQLVLAQARDAGIDAPLITRCAALYRHATEHGGAALDMVAVFDGVAPHA